MVPRHQLLTYTPSQLNDLKPIDFATVVAKNYGLCRVDGDRLDELQTWVRNSQKN